MPVFLLRTFVFLLAVFLSGCTAYTSTPPRLGKALDSQRDNVLASPDQPEPERSNNRLNLGEFWFDLMPVRAGDLLKEYPVTPSVAMESIRVFRKAPQMQLEEAAPMLGPGGLIYTFRTPTSTGIREAYEVDATTGEVVGAEFFQDRDQPIAEGSDPDKAGIIARKYALEHFNGFGEQGFTPLPPAKDPTTGSFIFRWVKNEGDIVVPAWVEVTVQDGKVTRYRSSRVERRIENEVPKVQQNEAIDLALRRLNNPTMRPLHATLTLRYDSDGRQSLAWLIAFEETPASAGLYQSCGCPEPNRAAAWINAVDGSFIGIGTREHGLDKKLRQAIQSALGSFEAQQDISRSEFPPFPASATGRLVTPSGTSMNALLTTFATPVNNSVAVLFTAKWPVVNAGMSSANRHSWLFIVSADNKSIKMGEAGDPLP